MKQIFTYLVVPGLVICGGSLGRVSGLDLATGHLRREPRESKPSEAFAGFVAELSEVGEVWSLLWHSETR